MTGWIHRNRILLAFLVAVPAIAVTADLIDDVRHGGRNEWAGDCIALAGGTGTNTCDETINLAVCVRGHMRQRDVPCWQIAAIAPGASLAIRPGPDGVETRLLACRAPWRPTRAVRQESAMRYGYACAPETAGLRLTE